MVEVKRTDSDDPDFIELVKQLDADLAKRDGEEHSFYDQFNKITKIRHVVLASTDGLAVGCGAFKEYEPGIVEIKRMYTIPEMRGKRIAALVLNELEKWASELLTKKCILETGKRQPEAISLYQRSGYQLTENYGQYKGIENSVCMAKEI